MAFNKTNKTIRGCTDWLTAGTATALWVVPNLDRLQFSDLTDLTLGEMLDTPANAFELLSLDAATSFSQVSKSSTSFSQVAKSSTSFELVAKA